MKRLLVTACLLIGLSAPSFAQSAASDTDYVFTPVKELKITPVKNQNSTGTCWCFSTLGFLESELLRTGKGEYDLSEMFIVNHTYKDKGEKFVRMHGELTYGEGGSFYDVLYAWKNYGIVPESEMTGLQYGEDKHIHGELQREGQAYLDVVIKNPNRKLSTAWEKGYDGIIDAYLGAIPEKFNYNGKEYTPMSFAQSLGLNMDDYVSIASFTHHPFYSKFQIEVQDNWRWSDSYNLPIDEFMQIFDNAINNGYTIAWGSDVSEKGFTRNGIAVVPDMETVKHQAGSDEAHWLGLSRDEQDKELKDFMSKPCKEMNITQEMRQISFDNYEMTDDHGMQIYGIAKDQTGKKYYMVKNSWGTNNKYKGTWYASEAFVKYKTLNIVVNKNAIPSAIRQKLGI